MSRLLMIYIFFAFIFYLTEIAYDRFCISISNNGLLFIPVAIIPLAVIIFLVLWFLQRNFTRSTDIYFLGPDQIVVMVQKVLNDIGWKDIRVSQTIQGRTTFSEPDKKYIVQTQSDQVKHSITVRSMDKKQKGKPVGDHFKKLLLREQAKSTYPIDPGMVLHFKKKYCWLFVLSWFSIVLCIYSYFFH